MVSVAVAVAVGVRVSVAVGVRVEVTVGVTVCVGDGMGDGVSVAVGKAVGVGVGASAIGNAPWHPAIRIKIYRPAVIDTIERRFMLPRLSRVICVNYLCKYSTKSEN